MGDFLSFRKMITPVVIQVLFWIGVVVVVIGAFVSMAQGQILAGLVGLILGPLMVRIYCELLILLFKIYESLQRIEAGKTGSTPTPITPQGFGQQPQQPQQPQQ